MTVSYDKSGAQVMSLTEYDIASSTEIKAGQPVKISAGKIVLVDAAETGAIIGIAAENHSGAADALDSRANGARIFVYDSPTAICESAAPEITATGGSATTIVSSGGLSSSLSNDALIGGYAVLTEKGISSTITDAEGTVYAISGSVGSTSTLTVATVAGGVTAGDKFAILPPVLFSGGNFDTNRLKLVLSSTAALPIRVVGVDTVRCKIFTEARLHSLANSAS